MSARLRRRLSWASSLVLVVMAGGIAGGYALLEGPMRWSAGPIPIHLQLGPSPGRLMDGSADWGASAESTLAEWNGVLNGRQFQAVRNSSVPIRNGDLVNNVFFSDTVHGRPFEDAVAVATSWVRGTERVEGDVIFNNRFNWNSYRGPIQPDASGREPLYDFRRVALHEFGHVLGLDHPDDAGQRVDAIMNGASFDEERLYPDDIEGLFALYGPVTPPSPPPPAGTPVVINFPPRNESLAFRNALEAYYRDVLRRSSTSSFVDVEGTVVWTQEYLRYRVNQCGHEDAMIRVAMQIDGRGIQPVCGVATSATFPPRNEPFDFRNRLEAVYRDALQRSAGQTFVDVEGDIVWTQEYLRYRVGRCTHDQAQTRVFQQIEGRGIAPVCG
jgi:hypothetical protein